MHRNFLIDGYNLIHAMGLIPGQVGPHTLEKARNYLLALLAKAHGDQVGNVAVVFDANKAPRSLNALYHVHGMEVHFAIRHKEADDLIAELIAQDSAPRKLVVVSDDREVLRSGSRRQCQTMTCETYLNWMEQQKQQKPKPPEIAAEKAEKISDYEMEHWLREFGDLDDDPGMREVFNPFDFDR